MNVPAALGTSTGAGANNDPRTALSNAVGTTARAASALRDLANAAADRENTELANDQRAIAREARRRLAQSNALLYAAADRMRLDITNLLEHSTGYAHQPWESDIWAETYDEPTEPASLVKVATLGLAAPDSVIELPFALPAIGSNVIITHTSAGRLPAHNLAHTLVTRALAASPPGSLRVHLLDAGGLGQNLGILGRLPEPLVSGGVQATHDEIAAELAAVREHVRRLDSTILLGEDDSLLGRWHDGTAHGVPCSLVLAAGLSAASTRTNTLQEIWALARTGNRCGVSVVAVIDITHELPPDVRLADLSSNTEFISVHHEGGATWESAPPALRHHIRIRCPNPPGANQHRFLTTVLAPAARRGSHRPVPLSDILISQPAGQAITTTAITAPIGQRTDGTPIDLSVGDQEGLSVGGIVVGPPGSGKTTLVHSYLHALVHRYSPEELELYLLNTKDGVEFAEYAPHPDQPALPHLRAVGIDADAHFALGVLRHLVAVDAERRRLFKKASIETRHEISTIAEYREITGRRLPRILFVADEFPPMLADPAEDGAWDALGVLARQGHSQGIHVLLATRSLNSVGSGRGGQQTVIDQLELRIGLRCEPDQLSDLLGRTVHDHLDTGRPGSGVLSQSRADAGQLFQAAELSSDERRLIRDQVVARYGTDYRVRVSRGSGGVDLSDVSAPLATTPTPILYVGAPVGVEPPLLGVPAEPGDGRGLLLADRDEFRAVGAISTMMAALAVQPGCADARFVIVDVLAPDSPGRQPLDQVVSWLGGRAVTLTDADLHLLPDVGGVTAPTFIAVLGIQYSTAGVPSGEGGPHPFSWLCGTAPSHRVFPLIWLDTPERLHMLGPEGERLQLRADTGVDIARTTAFIGQRPPYPPPHGRMWFTDLAAADGARLVDPFRVAQRLPTLQPPQPAPTVGDHRPP